MSVNLTAADRPRSRAARTDAPAAPIPGDRPVPRDDDLLEVIRAYHQVTERLETSHTRLTDEVRRLHAELASANAALQRSRRLAALGEMAAGIAHEVRNPLASIQLYARMLSDDLADRPPQRDTAEKIARAVRGLDAIVQDVLAFSRELRLQTMDGPALDLLESALESSHALIESAGVETLIRVRPATLTLAHDPNLLHRALLNLIANAAQAMEGRPIRRLTLEADREPDTDTVTLTVGDTGPGIAPDAVDRIFNPFFTTRGTGTGLGLAIVHRILDAHGGTITVRNDPAGGAVFTLRLPRRPQPDPVRGDHA